MVGHSSSPTAWGGIGNDSSRRCTTGDQIIDETAQLVARECKVFYEKIDSANCTPLWEVLHGLVTGRAQHAVPALSVEVGHGLKRDAGYQREALPDQCDSGVPPLVRGVSVELSLSGRNDCQERGVFVDHSSINRWTLRFLPLLEKVFCKYKRPVGGSWRMDETCILVKGVWKYLYRAVDKQGKTVDFLLTAQRDKAAAGRFFDKAMQANNVPEKITMDKSGANKTVIDEIKAGREAPIVVRQGKDLNNLVEQAIAPSNESRNRRSTASHFKPSKCAGRHRVNAYDSERSAHAGGLQ